MEDLILLCAVIIAVISVIVTYLKYQKEAESHKLTKDRLREVNITASELSGIVNKLERDITEITSGNSCCNWSHTVDSDNMTITVYKHVYGFGCSKEYDVVCRTFDFTTEKGKDNLNNRLWQTQALVNLLNNDYKFDNKSNIIIEA